MNINILKKREELFGNKKYQNAYSKLNDLVIALNKKEIPNELASTINEDIKILNSFVGTHKQLIKNLNKTNSKILKLVNDRLDLVSKNYYRNLGLALGIVFGPIMTMPFGVLGFNGIGMIVGLLFGIAIGTHLDKKAFNEGKQLDFTSNF